MTDHTWKARLVDWHVHDGDTLTRATLDIGWRVHLTGQSVRVTWSEGPINCPEVTGRERKAGLIVRDAVAGWLTSRMTSAGLWVVSRSIDRDAYGRTIGEIHSGPHEFASWLMGRGYAKPCEPSGKRVPFTDEELARIVGGGS